MKQLHSPVKRLCRRLGLALACVLAATPTVSAVSGPYAATDTRAAQLAAYRSLADRVLTLGVGGGTTVRGLVGRSDRVAAGLNRFLKRATLGTPFPHGDGIAVEAVVSRSALARALTELGAADRGHAARLRGGGPDRIATVGVADRTHADVPAIPTAPAATLVRARPRPIPTVTPPAPARITPRPAPGAFRRYMDDPVFPAAPPIPTDPAARLRARRAAEVDALRRLAERGGGVHVEACSTAIGGALTTDSTHVRVSATLPGVRFGPARDGADGTVEVDAAATLDGVSAPVTTTGTGLVSSEARP